MSKTVKPLGLGKGLSAIFESQSKNDDPRIATSVYEVEISKISPNKSQPRTIFDAEAISELADSIRRLGVIQPITVRAIGGGDFEIISGERRYRASKEAGLDTIPAYVRSVDDAELLEMALVENVQREELGAMEIALTIKRLIEELGITQKALGESIGKRRSTVSNYLRLLSLSPKVQSALRDEQITMGHAKVVASVEEETAQEKFLDTIIEKKLSVRAAEELLANRAKTKVGRVAPANRYTEQKQQLEQSLGKRRVKVQEKGDGGGKVVISFKSQEELEALVGKLS